MAAKENAELQSDAHIPQFDKADELSDWLKDESHEGQVVKTRLKASDRVIARVTDGIYRQPASALRELISNAWDADANDVSILTDAPRFSRIYVRDDGVGMSYQTLVRLLHSIGGSAKRTSEGQKLGVTSEVDADRTPGGRLLIGKIGIGLFSVSQLARRFRIVTKMSGNHYRLIAEVKIRTYSEDDTQDAVRDDDDGFVTGEVSITREHTPDLQAHGTDIILDDIKPRVRDMLRSADRWRSLDEIDQARRAGDDDASANSRVKEPRYHAGWIEKFNASDETPVVLARQPNLPWNTTTSPSDRMSLLMDAIERENKNTERPDLASTLDTYLETMWTLALSIPVGYIEKHPFDLTSEANVDLFWISNESKGQALALNLDGGVTVREAVKAQVPGHPELEDGLNAEAGDFRVTIDGVELRRPVRFRFIKTSSRGLDRAMLFVGRYAPNLEKVDASLRGGAFGLEAYLFWSGMVVPKENNGVLTRIRGAAGALFDRTFFNYQISEQTRLRQITSEIFIKKGLDAALNIDRESFNFSHPHVQFVGIWLHRAIRQLTNKLKDFGKRSREEKLAKNAIALQDTVIQHSETVWAQKQGDEASPEIAITPNTASSVTARSQGLLALTRSEIPALATTKSDADSSQRDVKAEALLRVLAAYEILDGRSYEEQQKLVDAILQIFFPSAIK